MRLLTRARMAALGRGKGKEKRGACEPQVLFEKQLWTWPSIIGRESAMARQHEIL